MALVEYCDGPNEDNDNRTLPFCHPTRVEDERLIYAVLGVLRKINSTYLSMVLTPHGPGNLIGVEMKDLCPENAPEKTAQICRLLIDNHYAGQSWMMSDCLAWYF
jgi:hypothetical protein